MPTVLEHEASERFRTSRVRTGFGLETGGGEGGGASGAAFLGTGAQEMWICAAVDVDRSTLRTQPPAAPVVAFQQPLAVIRAYAHDNLVEARPGFSEPLADVLDRKRAGDGAAGARAGRGAPATAAAAAIAAAAAEAGADLGAMVLGPRQDLFEGRVTHTFSTPSGAVYEYFVANADESADELAALDATNPAEHHALAERRAEEELFGAAADDPFAEVERQAVEELMNRVGLGFQPPPPPGQQLVLLQCELVAAAGFPTDSLAVHYEVLLPRRCRWSDAAGLAVATEEVITDNYGRMATNVATDLGDDTLPAPALEGITQQADTVLRRWCWKDAGPRRRVLPGRASTRTTPHRSVFSHARALMRADHAGADEADEAGLAEDGLEDEDEGVLDVARERSIPNAWHVARLVEPRPVPVAHLNYNFDVCFLQPNHDRDLDATLAGLRGPELILTVFQRDAWGRTHVLGYGHTHLPHTPGVHACSIGTWLPERTVRQGVSDFFLGGAGRLMRATDTAEAGRSPFPLVSDGGNKFGIRTASAGTLALRIDVAVQALSPVATDSFGSGSGPGSSSGFGSTPSSRPGSPRAPPGGAGGLVPPLVSASSSSSSASSTLRASTMGGLGVPATPGTVGVGAPIAFPPPGLPVTAAAQWSNTQELIAASRALRARVVELGLVPPPAVPPASTTSGYLGGGSPRPAGGGGMTGGRRGEALGASVGSAPLRRVQTLGPDSVVRGDLFAGMEGPGAGGAGTGTAGAGAGGGATAAPLRRAVSEGVPSSGPGHVEAVDSVRPGDL